jgi:hypothetical protein
MSNWSAFWRGFDIFGAFSSHDLPLTDEEAFERDRRALAEDWATIGRDMRAALPTTDDNAVNAATRQHWRRLAEQTVFMGQPVNEMSREEMLAVIGCFVLVNEAGGWSQLEEHANELDTKTAEKAARRVARARGRYRHVR